MVTKRKTKPKKAASKAKTKIHSFKLSKLLKLQPCNGGLAGALTFLRQKQSIDVPERYSQEFWAAVDRMSSYMHELEAKQTVSRLAKHVTIRIVPKIFSKAIRENGNFRSYSIRILGRDGKKIWGDLAFGQLRDQLMAQKMREHEEAIATAERNVRYNQDELQRLTREYNDVWRRNDRMSHACVSAK